MTDDAGQPALRTRRWFVAAVIAGVGSSLVGGPEVIAAPKRRRRRAQFFDIVHDRSVAVSMTNGRRFVVCVQDVTTGDELERHERVTVGNLLGLESTYFRIVERATP